MAIRGCVEPLAAAALDSAAPLRLRHHVVIMPASAAGAWPRLWRKAAWWWKQAQVARACLAAARRVAATLGVCGVPARRGRANVAAVRLGGRAGRGGRGPWRVARPAAAAGGAAAAGPRGSFGAGAARQRRQGGASSGGRGGPPGSTASLRAAAIGGRTKRSPVPGALTGRGGRARCCRRERRCRWRSRVTAPTLQVGRGSRQAAAACLRFGVGPCSLRMWTGTAL